MYFNELYHSGSILNLNTDIYGNIIPTKISGESYKVNNQGFIALSQIPYKLTRVKIDGMYEVSDTDEMTETLFKVDYSHAKVFFHASKIGKTITVREFWGIGKEFITADRIATQTSESGDVLQSLEEILEIRKQEFDLLQNYGHYVDVKKELEKDIINGTTTNTTLKETISTGNSMHTTLTGDISTGNTLHSNLQKDLNDGNTLHSNLQNDINLGNPLHVTLTTDIETAQNKDTEIKLSTSNADSKNTQLTKTISDANTAINNIHNTENKTFTILTTNWVLNNSTNKYEYTLNHKLNSKNLVMNFYEKNTLGGEDSCQMLNTPVDNNNTKFISDNNKEKRIVISVSYFGYMDTVDQLNNAVSNANNALISIEQKGNPSWLTKSTDWDYNSINKVYEYKIIHNKNSINILPIGYDSNGDAVSLGLRIINQNEVIVKHTKKEDLRVVLNFNFYGLPSKIANLSAFTTTDLIDSTDKRYVTDNQKSQIDKIGDLSSLNTTNKTTIVESINEIDGRLENEDQEVISINNTIGSLSNLKTTIKNNIVTAINNVHDRTVILESDNNTNKNNISNIQTEISNARNGKSTLDEKIDEMVTNISSNASGINGLVSALSLFNGKFTFIKDSTYDRWVLKIPLADGKTFKIQGFTAQAGKSSYAETGTTSGIYWKRYNVSWKESFESAPYCPAPTVTNVGIIGAISSTKDNASIVLSSTVSADYIDTWFTALAFGV